MRRLIVTFSIFIMLTYVDNVIAHRGSIIWYPSLEDDFLEFLEEFNQDRWREDPVWAWKPNFIDKECQSLQKAKVFKMQSGVQKIVIRSLTFEAVHDRHKAPDTREEKRTVSLYDQDIVYIKKQPYNLPFFRCLINSEMKLLWYVTYGFHGPYMYVFKEMESNFAHDPLHLELVGMVEESVRPNQIFRGQRHLERYFLNAHRMREPVPPHLDTLCSLTANQQFRLCCVIEDTLKRTDHREFHLTTKYDHSCLEQQPVRFHDYEDSDRKINPTADIRSNLVVCKYHDNQSEKTIFLANDPKGNFAVFVLEKIENSANLNDGFFLIAHVPDIHVIKYAEKIY